MITKFSDFQINESKGDDVNAKLNRQADKKVAKLDSKMSALRRCFLHDPVLVAKAFGAKAEDIATGSFVFDKEIKKCDYPHKLDIDKIINKLEKLQRTVGDSTIGVAINKFIENKKS